MMHQHLISNISLWLHFSSINIWEPSYKSILNISVQNTIKFTHAHFHNFYFIGYYCYYTYICYFLNNIYHKQFLFFIVENYIWHKKNDWNLINYNNKNPIWPPGGHFVKVTSLEINRLLIHTHKYRKSHCGGKTILRSSYLSIMGFPKLVRYIFIYIESRPGSDFLIETATAPGTVTVDHTQQLPCKSANVTISLYHIDGWVQQRRNSITNALELRLSCTNPSILTLCMLRRAN